MHVRFAHARRSDLDELGARAQRLDGGAAAVAHRRPQAAHELRDDRGEHTLVGHASLDAFGDEFLRRILALAVLEVAVSRALLHGAERAHPAIALVRAALIELGLARRLLGT